MNTSNWGDFVKGVSARVDEIIDDTKDMGPSFMSSGLFKKDTADGLIHRTEGVTGLGYLEDFDEDGELKSDRTYPAYKTEYTIKPKGKIINISQLLMKTRPAELEAKLGEVRQQMIAANRTLNKWAWQVLVDAFSLTNSEASLPISRLSDAVALISASHPSLVPGVANRSNLLSGNPVYSEENQNLAIIQLREMLNGRGLPISYEGKFVVVVPPALEKLAKEINKSVLRSGTTDNDFNYYNGIVDVVVSNYLGAAAGGSDTAWFVVAKDAGVEASLRYISLIEPKIERDVNFKTKSIEISVDMACAFGYSNFEYIAGASGAGA